MASGDWGGGGSDWSGPDTSGGGDTYTERSSEGWISRIGGAVVAIPAGLIFVVGSCALLFWNEGRAVKTAKGLAEGKAAVVSVEAGRVDPAHDGKLVHVSGEATTNETLKDPAFGISARALRLRRVVQMYQWKESSETRTRKKLGGGEEKTTEYRYERAWSDQPIDSSRFKKSGEHANPAADAWPFREWTGRAEAATLGAFAVPGPMFDALAAEPLPVGDKELEAVPTSAGALKLDAGRFYRGADPARPEVGDLTVAFEEVRPQVVSILARQSGQALAPFATKTGTTIARVQPGSVEASEMFRQAEGENAFQTWVWRAVGFIIMWIGLALMMSLLSVLADVIPFLGSLVGFGTGLLAFGGAAVISLATIALGWLSYRPAVGIAAIALAVLVLFGLARMGRARQRAATA